MTRRVLIPGQWVEAWYDVHVNGRWYILIGDTNSIYDMRDLNMADMVEIAQIWVNGKRKYVLM